MLVAVFVFSIVMVLATGAIFSIVNANKTSQAIKSVMDNLSSAIDSMSRDVRYGTTYHCGSGDFSSPQSCVDDHSGLDTSKFAFVDKNGVLTIYEFQASPGVADGSGSIYKCINDTASNHCVSITAPEVHIKNLSFYVQGAMPADANQPQLMIMISGYAQAGLNKSDFNIETLVSQRNLMCKSSMHALSICN